MAILGNVWLGLALLCYVFPWLPNFPRVREAIMRPKFNPIGPFYVIVFVVMPRFLRVLLAALLVWVFLALALVVVADRGGLAWTGVTLGRQYCLVAAGWLALALMTLGKTLAHYDVTYRIPLAVRHGAQGMAWVAPVVFMVFGLLALNPPLARFASPSLLHVPLVTVAAIAVLVAGIFFFRWLVPGRAPAAPDSRSAAG